MLNSLDMLERSNQLWVEAVEVVDDALLIAPTPCGDWNVTELLDHVTGGNRFSIQILSGLSAEDALRSAHESFDGAHHPVEAVVASAAAQLDAFAKPGRLAGTYHHIVGDLGGQDILRLRVHDVCVHIWDLLQAVRPGMDLDAEYAEWAIDELAKPDSLTARHMASQRARPRTGDEILAAFGRQQTEPVDN